MNKFVTLLLLIQISLHSMEIQIKQVPRIIYNYESSDFASPSPREGIVTIVATTDLKENKKSKINIEIYESLLRETFEEEKYGKFLNLLNDPINSKLNQELIKDYLSKIQRSIARLDNTNSSTDFFLKRLLFGTGIAIYCFAIPIFIAQIVLEADALEINNVTMFITALVAGAIATSPYIYYQSKIRLLRQVVKKLNAINLLRQEV